eukprot:3464503-Pyramimonas_sp.AAC.1
MHAMHGRHPGMAANRCSIRTQEGRKGHAETPGTQAQGRMRRGGDVHARHGGHPSVAANRCSIRMQEGREGSARQAHGVRGGGENSTRA